MPVEGGPFGPPFFCDAVGVATNARIPWEYIAVFSGFFVHFDNWSDSELLTLMSRAVSIVFHSCSNLFRATTLCLVLLQLTVLPATSVLHLGCAHGPHSDCSAASCTARHTASNTASHSTSDRHGGRSNGDRAADNTVACRCGAHHHAAADEAPAEQAPHSEHAPHEGSGHSHHDSDHCRICQTAFALTTADAFAVHLPVSGFVSLLCCPTESAPDCLSPFDCPGRGPPAAC